MALTRIGQPKVIDPGTGMPSTVRLDYGCLARDAITAGSNKTVLSVV